MTGTLTLKAGAQPHPTQEMKILLVADLHYTLKQWDWLCEAASHFEIVVVAGDLLELASIVPREAQAVVVQKYLAKLAPGERLVLVSGNHDLLTESDGHEQAAEWLREVSPPGAWIDGDHGDHGPLFFSVLPWWEGESLRGKIEDQLRRDADLVGDRRWVWIYHPPPHDTAVSRERGRDHGDPYLNKWIDRFNPFMVMGGHVHGAPFDKDGAWIDHVGSTWVLNAGRQIGPVPTCIAIDLENEMATWASLAGAERAVLRPPLAVEELG